MKTRQIYTYTYQNTTVYLADTTSKLLLDPLEFNRSFLLFGSHARTALHKWEIDGIVSTLKGWENVHKNPQNSKIWPKSTPSIRTVLGEGMGRDSAVWVSTSFSTSFPTFSKLFPWFVCVVWNVDFTELVELPLFGPDLSVLNASSLSQMISTRKRASSFLFLMDLERVSREVLTT